MQEVQVMSNSISKKQLLETHNHYLQAVKRFKQALHQHNTQGVRLDMRFLGDTPIAQRIQQFKQKQQTLKGLIRYYLNSAIEPRRQYQGANDFITPSFVEFNLVDNSKDAGASEKGGSSHA